MKFKKIKTLSFLEFVPPCPLMLMKRSKNLLKYDTTDCTISSWNTVPHHDKLDCTLTSWTAA